MFERNISIYLVLGMKPSFTISKKPLQIRVLVRMSDILITLWEKNLRDTSSKKTLANV